MRDQRVILGESDDPDRDYQDYRSLTISTYVEGIAFLSAPSFDLLMLPAPPVHRMFIPRPRC